MRQIFVHLHIPKCGGSTAADVLKRNFGQGLVDTYSILNDYQYCADQVARIINHQPDLKCLTGHKLSLDLPFNSNNFDIHAFTWIRDPVDRFLSHYFYHRNHTTFVPEAKLMDVCEYIEWALKSENQSMYINGQTRFLSGGSIETIESMVASKRLFLFPLSRLQESFYTLAQSFPESFIDVTIKNKNLSKKDQILPDNIRELVLPYVEKDMQLLKISRQTVLEETKPILRQESKNNVFRRKIAMKTSRFLRRTAYFIENGRNK